MQKSKSLILFRRHIFGLRFPTTIPHNNNNLKKISTMATPMVSQQQASFAPKISSATPKKGHQRLLSNELQLDKLRPSSPSYWERDDVKIIGHRGALYDAVENTLESFQKCIDWKCQGVELDIFLLRDGSLVVFHGSGTDKAPGALDGYCEAPFEDATSILDLTLEEAQQLQFEADSEHLPGASLPYAAAKAQIPTLKQVLELFQQPAARNMKITIEMKGEGTPEPAIQVVEELNMGHRVVFSSFKHDRVHLVKKLRPTFTTAATFPQHVPDNFLELLQRDGSPHQPNEIHLRYDTCSIDRVSAAHKAGFKVMAWCRGPKAMEHDVTHTYLDTWSDERHVYDLVLQTGVDAICCNRPQWAIDMLAQKRESDSSGSDSSDNEQDAAVE